MNAREEYTIFLDINAQLLSLLGNRMAASGRYIHESIQQNDVDSQCQEKALLQDVASTEDRDAIISVWDKILRLLISQNSIYQNTAIEEIEILQQIISMYPTFIKVLMPEVIAQDYNNFTREAIKNELLHDASVKMASIKNKLFKDSE